VAYTTCTQTPENPNEPVSEGMKLSITPYTRHRQRCNQTKRDYHKCGCPVWFYDPSKPREQQRYSSGTNDWNEALQKAAMEAENSESIHRIAHITVERAVNLYLVKRSKKLKAANFAPYKDKYMLRDGSKNQKSLLHWCEEKTLPRLEQVSASTLDTWRNGWALREESYAMKIYNAVVKAFFSWAVRFDYLAKNPMNKLDAIHVTEVPTLPLEPEELVTLLACANSCDASRTLTTAILLMRWSGLAITDATCLRRDRLDKDNRLRLHRKKTGEWVHVKMPDDVADMPRMHSCSHPDYFFWNKMERPSPVTQSGWFGKRLRRIYDMAKINPRGAHRLRDTFSVEFLNSGGLIEDLAMLLGHSNTNTTQKHYMPWVKSRQIRLDEAMDRSLAVQAAQRREQITAAAALGQPSTDTLRVQ